MQDSSSKSRDFNPMSVAGLSDEARQAVNAAFDAMSAWRIDIPERTFGARNQRRRSPPRPIESTQAFCHCSASCAQNCIGFIAAPAKASALGHVPPGLAPGGDFSFESIADEALIGLGDLICSPHISII